jgi:plastocyanin
MHTLALQLAPLAAEKSKVAFYVAGGLLVAWALIVSLALGLRRPQFPGNQVGQRGVIAITVVLVLAALSTAVLTAGGSPSAGAAGSSEKSASTEAAPSPAPPAASSSSAAAPPPAASGGKAQTAPASGGGASSLKLATNAGGLLSFDTKQLSAKGGAVTITLTNASPIEHNVAVAQGAAVIGSTPTFVGGSRTLTVNLKPGTYTFYCTVPGHRQAGMEGTLKIT